MEEDALVALAVTVWPIPCKGSRQTSQTRGLCMLDASYQRWQYKIVIGSAHGPVSLDHVRCEAPLPQILQQLVADGWKLVGQSELPGPCGAHVTCTLRRPA